MRISIFPKGELEALVEGTLELDEWIARAAELPIEGVELYSRFLSDDSAVDRARAALDAHGLAMPMLCCSPDLSNPDPRVRAAEAARMREHIDVARALGGPGACCRVLTGQRHPGLDAEETIGIVAEAIIELVSYATGADVVLGLENHYKDGFWQYPEFAQRPEVFLRVLDAIPLTPHFGVQFDPSNALTAGTDSADFLELVVDRVVTMQASDRYLADGLTLDGLRAADGTIGYHEGFRHGVIGRGLNDYGRIFTTLAESGYNGWISVEDGVNGWDEMAASVEFLRAARTEHFGGSFGLSVPASAVAERQGSERRAR
ncbi:MAG: sugar phosphate isomerase/epimerase family protein [Microbacterium sp.]|uniref:sugar phosphate isomerase/epimerase family protein n=1 Tax=Microbacterium sp. TaxID=51671 RepID=UPI0039E27A34